MEFFSATTIQTTFKKALINQHKSYKFIKLSNELRAFIISDPSTINSSCAIAVKSGSFNDPIDLNGLAHLCEHMLFMGSSMFPNPNEFFNCLNSLGGNTNAFTMGEFFKNPLFNEDCLMNEINAVNDEHQLNIVNDGKVLYHGLRLLTNENHPFSRFGTGNKNTLTDKRRLRTEVAKYFNENFFAENMMLVIKSNLSLNQLQKLVIAQFSDIPRFSKQVKRISLRNFGKRRNTTGAHHHYHSSSFSSSSTSNNTTNATTTSSSSISDKYPPLFTKTNKVLFIRQENTKKIRLIYEIEENPFYENVWCNLLGDETKNSLCYCLKQSKLIESMFIFTQTISRINKVLLIDLQVKNLANINMVIDTISEFINQITNTDKATVWKCLQEYSKVFKYHSYFQQDESTSMDEVSHLCEMLLMNHIPVDDILLGDHYQVQGDVTDFIYHTKKTFDKKNLNVIMLADNLPNLYANQETHINKDPYYLFDYQILNLDKHSTKQTFPIFHLLQTNPFISLSHNQLDYLIENSKKNIAYVTSKQNPEPKLFDYSKNHELWISEKDPTDMMVLLTFQIILSKNSILNYIAMEIIVEKLGQILYSEFYPGEFALFSWGIYANYAVGPSLCFTIRGPKFGYDLFLNKFINRIYEIIFIDIRSIGYKEFVILKNKLRSNYHDLQNGDSMKQVLGGSTLLLESGIWTIEERIDALEFLDTVAMGKISMIVENDLKLTKVLISGNFDHEFVFSISKKINKLTNHLKIYLENSRFPEPSSIMMKAGKCYNFTLENNNKQDSNDVVYHYIQICQRQDELARSMAHFLAFLISSDIIYKLRTKKQIGYIVLSGVRYNKQSMGIYMYVSSSTYSYLEIQNEINQFLFEWELQLINMTHEELSENIKMFIESMETQQEGLPSNILYNTPPSHHSDNFTDSKNFDLHKNYYEKIITKNYRFKNLHGKEEINTPWLESLTVHKMVKFFQLTMSIKSATRSTLSIFISSSLGKSIQSHNESKQILNDLLQQHNYHLTSLQIENLLNDSNNNLSKAVKKLKSAGYSIQLPKNPRFSKLLTLLHPKTDHSLMKMQQVAIDKYGTLYNDSEVVVIPVEVRSKNRIHAESTHSSITECHSGTLEKFANMNKSVDDLDMILY
ncbi:AXL1 putative protease AXL1 [Candida maltosa Xu316]